jgi:hypothetical protein
MDSSEEKMEKSKSRNPALEPNVDVVEPSSEEECIEAEK